MASLTLALLIRFLWGWSVAQTFVSRKEASEKYLFNSFLVIFGLSLSILGFIYLQNPINFELLYATLSILIGNIAYTWGRHFLWRIGGLFLYSIVPLYFLYEGFWHGLNFIISSTLLGSIFASMFLGHWYLNVSGLHIKELRRLNNICLISLYAKVVELGTHFFLNHWQAPVTVNPMGQPLNQNLNVIENLESLTPSASLFGLTGDYSLGLGLFGLLMLIARILWGLVAPAILLHLTSKTIAIRATQSATGLLYSACVMVLLGEATAVYLQTMLNWFL